MSGVDILPVELAAFEHQLGLGEDRSGHLDGSLGGEPGLGDFIASAAGFDPEQVEGLALRLGEGAQGEGGVGFDKLEGVAVRAHHHLGIGPAPHAAQRAPGDGHGVEMAGGEIAAGEQEPAVLPDGIGAGGEGFDGNGDKLQGFLPRGWVDQLWMKAEKGLKG